MTREECEHKVLDLLEQIKDVCEEYHPGMLVCMGVSSGNRWSAFALSDEDEGKRRYLLDTTHFGDGTLHINGKYYYTDGSVYDDRGI